MATTNDAMYEALRLLYPSAGATLGDLLYTHWSTVGVSDRSLIYQYYVANGALGDTLGDIANNFWSDPDYVVSNLEDESGNDLLLEDGFFILLEASNA